MSIEDSGAGATVGWATSRGRNWPTLRQFTVFLENRVGQLLEVVRRFDGSRVRIVGGVRRSKLSAAAARMLVSFFSLVGLTSISSARAFSPTIIPS